MEKYRGINVQHDWWDSLFEDFVRELSEIGIEVDTTSRQTRSGKPVSEPDIYFSGFCSQGDGASFDGSVSSWPAFLTHLNQPRFIECAEEMGWRSRSDKIGRYSHSGMMHFTHEMDLKSNPFDPDNELLQHEAWRLNNVTEKDVDELCSLIEAKFIELADDMYRRLDEEHDYLTDDEQVVSWILNNAPEELVEEEEIEA